ncbi:MAG: hypothetical protein M1813_002392 [Trichoglossum hirsutum]|nr:MAG: hypothetical protein M1813_002392 [Trichoglossum hirsutum]
MSTNSIAAFRQGLSTDLQKLADQHLQHDLQQSDRDTLKSAASRLSTHVSVGSIVGLGLGFVLAWRFRSQRVRFFNAFRASQRPTHVKFADGREEAIPDITPLLQPTVLGDIAAYVFFPVAGVFLGGETGVLTGVASTRRMISNDPGTRERVDKAFKAFRADTLRKEIDLLESEKGSPGLWG